MRTLPCCNVCHGSAPPCKSRHALKGSGQVARAFYINVQVARKKTKTLTHASCTLCRQCKNTHTKKKNTNGSYGTQLCVGGEEEGVGGGGEGMGRKEG